MSVNQLFEDIGYGITKLREYPSHFDFYYRGSLASLRATLDYLLEEYNQKFALGIKPDAYLKESWSKKAQVNPTVKQFNAFYEAERRTLLDDEVVNRLIGHGGERNLIMHRTVSPKKYSASLNFVSDLSIPSTKEGRKPLRPVGAPKWRTFRSSVKTENILSERDIADECEHCLVKLKDFVAKVRERFP